MFAVDPTNEAAMEKFAVDLDKVLDDFEFNEDCAEQIASVNLPSNSASSPASKRNLESPATKNYNCLVIEPEKSSKEFNITTLEKNRDPQQANLDVRNITQEIYPGPSNTASVKNESIQESTDSVNHFYTQDCAVASKLTQKQAVLTYDSEPVPLTIHNDISHKFLQKQQNGSGSPKIDNRYDKKLNQPSSKPSVSNVFNSLNEYINAPSGGLDYVHTVLEDEGIGSSMKVSNSQVVHSISGSSRIKNQQVLGNDVTDTSSANLGHNNINTALNIVRESVNLDYQNVELSETLESVVESVSDNTEQSNVSIISVPSSEKLDSQMQLSDLAVPGISVCIDAVQQHENIAVDSFVITRQTSSTIIDSANLENESPYYESDIEQTRESLNDDALQEHSETKDSPCQSVTVNIASTDTINNTDSDIPITEEKEKSQPLDPRSSNNSGSSEVTRKVFDFSNLGDLSEEELTKYLAELEEEERLNDRAIDCESQILESTDEVPVRVHSSTRDEDAHEAPIFESVTIGELPMISQEELTEKAKKFPIIDYSKNDTAFGESSEEWKPENPSKDPVNSVQTIHQDLLTEDESRQLEDFIQNPEPVIAETSSRSQEVHTVSGTEARSSQEQSTYSMNIEQGLLNDAKLKQKTLASSVPSNPFGEIITQNDSKSSVEERRSSHDSNISRDSKTVEPPIQTTITDPSDELEKPTRPQTLDIVLPDNSNEPQAIGSTSVTSTGPGQSDPEGPKEDCQGSSPDALDSSLESSSVLGKQPPFWIPDSDASSCMLCEVKFTMLKRRHHCRACGKVLCNKCCSMKYKLEYQGNIDSRVCVSCYQLLTKAESEQGVGDWSSGYSTYTNNNEINSPQGRQPNPNNPMEYCSTIPPLQQLAGGLPPPPTVMVPVGVLKREGGTKHRPEGSKSVMFSDELDMSWDLKPAYRKSHGKRISTASSSLASSAVKRPNLPRIDPSTECYVPQDPNVLPPTVTIHKGQVSYHAVTDEELLYRTLKNKCEPPVMFAINRNLYAYVKITNLNCCVNKICWNVTSRGLACVGQDEVILLVETLPDEMQIPKDLFIFINQLYVEAIKGNTVSELGFAIYQGGNLLGSREHAGFLFIRQTLQCLQKIVLPPAPFLVGLLVHRWETPWAKVFPLRLLLRLGAEYRYYPCPLVSVRFRDALYFEIGHTVMKVLADFRTYSYTLPSVRGLTIHLRNRMTDVMFPRNRYDQVIKGLNNSNDHVLAYASNFSIAADSHLVCIQTNTGDESSYQTQAINIHNKPRTVTGASFIVINGALKSSMGLSAKSSIVEDGLMVEIMPEKMEALKAALKNMQDFSIGCGRQGAPEPDETVNIKWVENDVQFNIGVKSPIDGQLMDGIPSIRVHNGTDYKGTSRFIRWTEVFIIKSDDHPNGVHDPVDINKLSGNIAKATCTALVKLLDLLATAGLTKLAVRTTIHPDNVGYEAGSEGTKLPPIYMNSLDNELIQVLHKAAQSSQDTHTVLELIFYVLDD